MPERGARQAASRIVGVLLLAGCAASPRTVADSGLARLVACPDLDGAHVGVLVVDTADGTELAAWSADRGFLPASNMKLLSCAVALQALGPEHRMATEVWLQGTDLMLKGGGDPTFLADAHRARQLGDVAAALRAAGVAEVGTVTADDSWLGAEHLGHGWQWDYLHEDYAAPFGGLCCAGNVLTLTVTAGAHGPVVVVDPPVVPVNVRIAAGDRTRLEATRSPAGAPEVVGTFAPGAPPQKLRVAVVDPARFAADVVLQGLRAGGFAGTSDKSLHGETRLLVSLPSPPLADVVAPTLRDSDNLCAEQLLRVASRVATGDGGTHASARHARAVLGSLGVDTAGLVIADGSGLSRRNLVRPRQLVRLLSAMRSSPHAAAFRAGLPVAGETGTLRNRFASGPARGHVRAKTGFVSRVVCLSGYVERPDGGAPLVFSVMVNDFTCEDAQAKAAVDAFVQELAAATGWPRV